MRYEENKKPDRRKDSHPKKSDKKYFDDDSYSRQKLNKQFKHKKRSLQDEDDSWEDWSSYKDDHI